MLCMTRAAKPGHDGITLKHRTTGEVIRVVVTRVMLSQCKIAIDAGADWSIVREELIAREGGKHD